MSSINTVSPSSTMLVASDTPKVKPGKFEQDSEQYGPIGAAIVGVGDAVGQAASSIVSLSSQGLHELASDAESAYASVKSAVKGLGSGVETLAGEIGTAVHSAGQTIGQAVDQVENAISSTTSTVADAAGSAAGYVALGVATGKQIVSEMA